jgi:hypothetical protein
MGYQTWEVRISQWLLDAGQAVAQALYRRTLGIKKKWLGVDARSLEVTGILKEEEPIF